jgi:hypothetical protein
MDEKHEFLLTFSRLSMQVTAVLFDASSTDSSQVEILILRLIQNFLRMLMLILPLTGNTDTGKEKTSKKERVASSPGDQDDLDFVFQVILLESFW